MRQRLLPSSATLAPLAGPRSVALWEARERSAPIQWVVVGRSRARRDRAENRIAAGGSGGGIDRAHLLTGRRPGPLAPARPGRAAPTRPGRRRTRWRAGRAPRVEALAATRAPAAARTRRRPTRSAGRGARRWRRPRPSPRPRRAGRAG